MRKDDRTGKKQKATVERKIGEPYMYIYIHIWRGSRLVRGEKEKKNKNNINNHHRLLEEGLISSNFVDTDSIMQR